MKSQDRLEMEDHRARTVPSGRSGDRYYPALNKTTAQRFIWS
jgi:hypothetical protein